MAYNMKKCWMFFIVILILFYNKMLNAASIQLKAQGYFVFKVFLNANLNIY